MEEFEDDNLIRYDESYLRAKFFGNGSNPYYLRIFIEKNHKNNKFYLMKEELDGGPSSYEYEFNTFEEAVDYLSENNNIPHFKLTYIKINKIDYFITALLKSLNSYEFYPHYNEADELETIEEFEIEEFENLLGIKIAYIHNAKLKGLQIVHMIKNKGLQNEIKNSFVGKIGFEGNIVVIKDEFDNINYLTSSENLIIQTEITNSKYYWYKNS